MQLQKILRNPHCYTNNGGLGLTNQESAVINEVAGQLNKASQMHKAQSNKLKSLGSTNFGNTENIKFVAWEVLKLTGIMIVGGLALGVPAHMIANNRTLSKASGDEIKKLRLALMRQPIKTASWWAGGSSVLIGAKDNKPKQMAAGAGLMAYSAMIPPEKIEK